jgi:hypothetical protein
MEKAKKARQLSCMMLRVLLLMLALTMAVQHVAAGQSKQLDAPPTILNLGSNLSDGSVTVTCTGQAPYSNLSCKVYHLSVDRPSTAEYEKWRAALQKDLAAKSDSEIRKMQQALCSKLSIPTDLANALKDYSPGRAASARNGYEQMQDLCKCATKQCITSVMLEQQTHEQNKCTIHSTVFSADFVKVSGRKWASNNGPEGTCGVISVLTMEQEENYPVLWTYTEQDTVTNNSEGFCKGLPRNSATTYSWKSGSEVRLKCEEFKFSTLPEF